MSEAPWRSKVGWARMIMSTMLSIGGAAFCVIFLAGFIGLVPAFIVSVVWVVLVCFSFVDTSDPWEWQEDDEVGNEDQEIDLADKGVLANQLDDVPDEYQVSPTEGN